jgi:hypothetical protein
MGVQLSAAKKALLAAGVTIEMVEVPYSHYLGDEEYETRYDEKLVAMIDGHPVQSYTSHNLYIDCKWGGANEWIAEALDRLGVKYTRE